MGARKSRCSGVGQSAPAPETGSEYRHGEAEYPLRTSAGDQGEEDTARSAAGGQWTALCAYLPPVPRRLELRFLLHQDDILSKAADGAPGDVAVLLPAQQAEQL